jgi:hypothetical protein
MYELIIAAKTFISRASAVALLIASQGAFAADDVWQPKENNPAWQNECGSCHMAFPPALLSGDDWRRLMQGLDKHFGVDASLEPKMRDDISLFLERNAASGWGHSADSQRITETGWFMRKHKAAISMVIKGRVKSLVDCMACHTGH